MTRDSGVLFSVVVAASLSNRLAVSLSPEQ
jgi:hypothetical protein